MAKAAINLFEKAKAAAPKGSPKKPEAPRIETEGLAQYAMIDALEKQLKSLKETIRPTIDEQMYAQFLANRGQNYKGKESTHASASLELRKRSSASGLTDAEVTICEKKGISLTRIEGDFKLNLTGMSVKKLEEVSAAINSVKGLPEDFLTFDGSKARTITTETSIEEAFKLNDPEDIKQILMIVGTLGIKPKTDATIGTIIAVVGDLLVDDE